MTETQAKYETGIKKYADHVGRQGYLMIKAIKIPVVILNVRFPFGRVDYKVTPVDGTGEMWVSDKKIEIRK